MAEITVKKPSRDELDELAVGGWPIWACDVSTFDWHYDQQETCYVLEGQVTVTAGGTQVRFGAGDFVVFAEGLDCIWDVTAPVKKHYKFG